MYHNVFGLKWGEVNFCHLAQRPWHLEIQVHLAHHWNLASEVLAKYYCGVPEKAFKMQVRNAYFRSLMHSSQKLWPKPD